MFKRFLLALIIVLTWQTVNSQIYANRGLLTNSTGAVLTESMYNSVALDSIEGYMIDTKFGRNSDIDTGPEDIWEGGGTYTGQPTSFTPETVTVTSTDPDDTAAGTGARQIVIFGLQADTSSTITSDTLTMNGTGDVTSSTTWWRLFRAFVLTAGSSGENEGVITVNSTTTTANIFVSMQPAYNQTTVGAFEYRLTDSN